MADNLPAVTDNTGMDFLKFLTGLNGTSGSSSATSTADPATLAQLRTLLGTMMGQTTPEGASALIGEVFRIGSRQVPILQQQFAQSAGARSSNNSPLLLANTRLQSELSGKALEMLSGLQTNAANAGGKILDATKTTSTTSTTGKASNASKAMALLPFLAGQSGNIKKLGSKFIDQFGGSDTGFGSVSGGSGVPNFVGNNPSAYVASGASAPVEVGESVSGAFPGLDFSAMDMGAVTSPVAESLVEGTDLGSLGLDSLGELFGSGADFGSLDLGLFLADGGLVPAGRKRVQKKSLVAKPRGYADGGVVEVSGSPMGEAGSYERGTELQTDAGMYAAPTGADFTADVLPQDVIDFYKNAPSTISNFNVAATLDAANPSIYYNNASDGKNYMLTGNTTGGGGEEAYDMQVTGIQQRQAYDGDPSKYGDVNPIDKMYNRDGTFQDVATNTPSISGTTDFLNFLVSAVGLMTGNPMLAMAKSLGTKAVAGALEPDSFSVHQFGGVKKKFADGGPVAGSKAADPKGIKDRVVAHLSPGEYVVSKDVVDAIGVEFLDHLQAQFHTPAAIQATGAK